MKRAVYKTANNGVIIAALEVIEASLIIVIIASIADGVDMGNVIRVSLQGKDCAVFIMQEHQRADLLGHAKFEKILSVIGITNGFNKIWAVSIVSFLVWCVLYYIKFKVLGR